MNSSAAMSHSPVKTDTVPILDGKSNYGEWRRATMTVLLAAKSLHPLFDLPSGIKTEAKSASAPVPTASSQAGDHDQVDAAGHLCCSI